ncbi:hypothetical protein C0Q70_11038 [Pomacea canaliculata]|uniref:Transmembrane protein 242 n=2 Tax=Pomacea canaliculata TaxID=400727 RepID=A0A2T7P4W5_POMCA|nr:hypothetical protein C0Q70_11038 [Pomacea canaliculata]
MSILGGFGMTIAMAKRKDPHMFVKGLLPSREVPESGGSLAMRALGWGTLYSVAGVGSICFVVWKLLGVQNLNEFREKVGSVLPRIPKKENPGRGDFRTLRELLEYIIEEDTKKKSAKES